MYTAAVSASGFGRKLKLTVRDSTGGMLCVAMGKNGFGKGSFEVQRPVSAFKGQAPAATDAKSATNKVSDDRLLADCQTLYPFGMCDVKVGFATTANYSVLRGDRWVPMYQAKMIPGLSFRVGVEDADGRLVAKVVQPGCDPSRCVVHVAQGVDVAAVAVLATSIAFAQGSSAVGGLAGAGAV